MYTQKMAAIARFVDFEVSLNIEPFIFSHEGLKDPHISVPLLPLLFEAQVSTMRQPPGFAYSIQKDSTSQLPSLKLTTKAHENHFPGFHTIKMVVFP